MAPEKMERGTTIDACKAPLEAAETLDIRQTRRGWRQEILGYEAQLRIPLKIPTVSVASVVGEAMYMK
jgi:hypothetical protein